MSKKQTKKTPKRGRRPKNIDFSKLKKLCEMHCTRDEVCSFFEINKDTLLTRVKEEGYDDFSDYYKRHCGVGKIALRRAQIRVALKGNASMLIWLGKNYLEQTDAPSKEEMLEQKVGDIFEFVKDRHEKKD